LRKQESSFSEEKEAKRLSSGASPVVARAKPRGEVFWFFF
jgi:hypothetical protein